MTERQKRFVDEYLIDLNATSAYKAAYPNIKNDNTARANGSRLLADANIRSYIDEELKKMNAKKIADAQEVMEYLSKVMRGEPEKREVAEIDEDGTKNTIENMFETPQTKERLKAAELLAKRYGILAGDTNNAEFNQVIIVGGDNIAD